jgi:hypothetical protein
MKLDAILMGLYVVLFIWFVGGIIECLYLLLTLL